MTWPGAVARFAMRQSLRWPHVAPIAIVVVLLSTTGQPAYWLTVVPVFGLIYAFPYAATQFVQADRDGRLNHLRVTGHAPAALLASLAFGWAGPLVVLGSLWLAVLWIAGPPPAVESLLLTAAVVGGSLTLSLLALVLPRGERAADSRLVAIALGFFALVASVLQINVLQSSRINTRGFLTATLIVLIAEIFVSVICIPFVVRTVERPTKSTGRRGFGFRVKGFGFAPVAAHAFSLVTPAALFVAALAAGVLLVLKWQFPDLTESRVNWGYVTLLGYVALLVGAFVISTGARADRDSGRLELLRASPRSPLRVVLELAAGVGLPFIAATLVLHLVAFALWGERVGGLTAAVIAAFVLAPVAGLEGWRGAWPLTLVVPMSVLVLRLADGPAPYARVALVAWIPWVAPPRPSRQPTATPLGGVPAVAAGVCLAVVLLMAINSPTGRVADLSGLLIIAAGLTIDPRQSRARDIAVPALAIAITTAAMFWTDVLGPVHALAIAPAPALAWWIGSRIHMWLGRVRMLSIMVRVALAVVLTTYWPFLIYNVVGRISAGAERAVFIAHAIRTALLLTGALVAAALVIEAAYQVWQRRGRQ